MSKENTGISKEDIDSDSQEFHTPTKQLDVLSLPSRSISPFITKLSESPTKSPGKRGIIRLGIIKGSPINLSPAKTPTGRAGLVSPKKRSFFDLDRSARKRAVKSSNIYSRLLEADDTEDPDNAYLNDQDLSLADAIIKQSRDEKLTPYGSDIEFEEDLTITKAKRGRPKGSKNKINDLLSTKANTTSIKEADTEESLEKDSEEDEDIDDSEEEYVERYLRRAKSQKRKYISEEDDDEDDDEDDEDDELSDDIDSSPRRRGRKASGKFDKESKSRVKRKYVKSKDKEPVEKRKVGRPSKADEVIGKVKSIFQMDDEAFFKENRNINSDPPSSPQKNVDSEVSSLVPLNNFDTTANTSIPIISGIPASKDKKIILKDPVDVKHFVPMPIPKVSDDGQIIDSDFIDKYFPNSNINSEENIRLTDNKSFFLEGTEGYFEQHSIRTKPSANSLSQLAPDLDYDEFLLFISLSNLIQKKERTALNNLHKSLYHQWCFELSQGFNINFYGIGSKISLILDFVQDYFPVWYENKMQMDSNDSTDEFPNILVVNGYNPTLKFKRILQDIVSSFIPQEKKHKDKIKFPKHVSETVPFIMNYIEARRTQQSQIKPKLILVIHNIDGEALRDDKTQNLLSSLCSLPEIWLISSTDNINVSLLWDSFKLKNYNFLWHDLTTYDSYGVEMSFKDVLSIGQSKKFVGNKGAKYVLSSLTSNARNLYKILLEKQLEIMKSVATTKAARTGLRGTIKFGVEFKSFYSTCLEEFVTSNEISFRTILGEFIEHKMCNLTKDGAGVEMIFVPFSFDEMQKIIAEEF